jgi:hypothetical protein
MHRHSRSGQHGMFSGRVKTFGRIDATHGSATVGALMPLRDLETPPAGTATRPWACAPPAQPCPSVPRGHPPTESNDAEDNNVAGRGRPPRPATV